MSNLTLPAKKRGDTWLFSFIWKSPATPVNLTNCTGRMYVRLFSDPTVVGIADEITIAPEDEYDDITSLNNFIVSVKFDAGTTAQLIPGLYQTDVELTFIDGMVQSSDTYLLTVNPDQTY